MDELAGRHPQLAGVLGEHLVDQGGDARAVGVGDVAVVQGDRRVLGLHLGAGDLRGRGADPLGDLGDEALPALGGLVDDRAAGRVVDVEAVAAGDDQVVDAHQLGHHAAVATGDHAHRRAAGERAHDPAHLVVHDRVLGTRDDRRQHAVVVEEDRGPASVEALGDLGGLQRVRQPIRRRDHGGDGAIRGARREGSSTIIFARHRHQGLRISGHRCHVMRATRLGRRPDRRQRMNTATRSSRTERVCAT